MRNIAYGTLKVKRPLILRFAQLLSLTLVATLFSSSPNAAAAAPAISAISTVGYGTLSPSIILTGTNFSSVANKFDFTVGLGSTGLYYDSVAYVSPTQVRVRLTGSAQEGSISIQGNTSSFDPVTTAPSNTLIISVPAAPIFQSISFNPPDNMRVNGGDQALSASASSGLTLSLSSITPGVCTVNLSKVHAVSVGTCSIKASNSGDGSYSAAVDVIKNFTIFAAEPAVDIQDEAKNSVALNLTTYAYFPDVPVGSYVDITVAPNVAGQASPTQLKMKFPSRATAVPAVFLISAFSSDEESSQGYFVTRVSLVDKVGTAITYVAGAYEINMPAGNFGAELYWSGEGSVWQKIPESKIEFLPMDSHAIYFLEKDGSSSILTDRLGLFGYRKTQAPVSINSPVTLLKQSIEAVLGSSGGSGSGAVVFGTTTSDICSVTANGVLTGVSTGECLVTASKFASANYIDSLSNQLSIKIEGSLLPVANKGVPTSTKSTCDSLSYSLTAIPANIQADFCPTDAGKTAVLYVRSNSSTRKWVDKKVASVIIDSTGRALFPVAGSVSNSKFLHVFVDREHRI